MQLLTIRNDTYNAEAIQMIGLNEARGGRPLSEVIVLLNGRREVYECATQKQAVALLKKAVADWNKALPVIVS